MSVWPTFEVCKGFFYSNKKSLQLFWVKSSRLSLALCWQLIREASPLFLYIKKKAVRKTTGHARHAFWQKLKAHEWRLPDMVVAELGILRPVEEHRPRRGVYGIRLGSGPGHLIICLAVTGGRASRSCTVGLMGERRSWVSANERQRAREEER